MGEGEAGRAITGEACRAVLGDAGRGEAMRRRLRSGEATIWTRFGDGSTMPGVQLPAGIHAARADSRGRCFRGGLMVTPRRCS